MKFGFVKDKNNLQLMKVLKNKKKLKDIHIDIYSENPLASSTSFMLLLRTSEKNVIVSNDDKRLILLKDDRFNTYLLDILISKISECFYVNNESYSEFILNIQNIYYKITIFN